MPEPSKSRISVVGQVVTYLDAANFTRAKMEWHQHVLADHRLRLGPKVLAGFLLHDFNQRTGFAWRSQVNIAAVLGVNVRSVQNWSDELAEAGHLEIEVAHGRGRTNRYRAVIKNTNDGSPYGVEMANDSSSFDAANTNRESPFGADNTNAASPIHAQMTNGHTGKPEPAFVQSLRDSPRDYPLTPNAAVEVSGRHLSQVRAAEASQGLGEGARTACVPDKIRAVAVAATDEGFVRSYLDPASWDASRQVVVARGPTALSRLTERLKKRFAEFDIRIIGPPD